MISSYGYKIIIITTVLFAVLLVLNFIFEWLILGLLAILVGIVFVFNFYFFRDPERTIPIGENLILAPADGTIIKIEEVEEDLYFRGRALKVSIFLSVFNVHINRIPISGQVEYLDYYTGKFLAAFDHRASDENEQSIIGIRNGERKLLFKQIAGVIARRIVYEIQKDDMVQAGNRFGCIRYGSRVDMFLPPDVKLHIKLKEKVKGGETIIGAFS